MCLSSTQIPPGLVLWQIYIISREDSLEVGYFFTTDFGDGNVCILLVFCLCDLKGKLLDLMMIYLSSKYRK